jgi:peptide/nickel transport system permease protein
VTLAAALAPAIAPHDPEQGDLRFAKLPPAWNSGGDPSYLLGTDQLGRDIVSRMLFGARISLLVGITVVAIAGTLGVIIGLVAGYYGGRIDDGLMRIADIQLAVPFILFAISVMAVLGPGLLNLIVVLGLSSWVSYGRVVRGTVLALRAREFVEAAQASGAGTGRILFRHILPNVVAPVLVVASFAVASAILSEAALSFLGLGVPPATPSWGGMVASGRDGIQTGQWWMATFPGLAIMLTVLGINVVGDWLRDYFDPRLRV